MTTNARKFFATSNATLLRIASENKADPNVLAEIKLECELRLGKNPKSQASEVYDYVVNVASGDLHYPMPTVIPPKVRLTAAPVPVATATTPESVAAAIRASGLDANDVIVALARGL